MNNPSDTTLGNRPEGSATTKRLCIGLAALFAFAALTAAPVASNTVSEMADANGVLDLCNASFSPDTGYSPEPYPTCHGFKENTAAIVTGASASWLNAGGIPIVGCVDAENPGSPTTPNTACAIGFDFFADTVAGGAQNGDDNAVTFGSDYGTATAITVESAPAGCYRVFVQIRDTATNVLSVGYTTPNPPGPAFQLCGAGGAWAGVECIGTIAGGQDFTYSPPAGSTIERVTAVRLPEPLAANCASTSAAPRTVTGDWDYSALTTTSTIAPAPATDLQVNIDLVNGGCDVVWAYDVEKTASTYGIAKGYYAKNGLIVQVDEAVGTGTQGVDNDGTDQIDVGDVVSVYATAWSHGDAGAELGAGPVTCTNPPNPGLPECSDLADNDMDTFVDWNGADGIPGNADDDPECGGNPLNSEGNGVFADANVVVGAFDPVSLSCDLYWDYTASTPGPQSGVVFALVGIDGGVFGTSDFDQGLGPLLITDTSASFPGALDFLGAGESVYVTAVAQEDGQGTAQDVASGVCAPAGGGGLLFGLTDCIDGVDNGDSGSGTDDDDLNQDLSDNECIDVLGGHTPLNGEDGTTLECLDGVNNDGSGDGADFDPTFLISGMGDADCNALPIGNEDGTFLPQCIDGIDNDGDGGLDYPADPGCSSIIDNEHSENLECDDYADNGDSDGLNNLADPGCSGPADDNEIDGQCDDTVDNGDTDGVADGADPGCASTNDPSEIDGECDDTIDNGDTDTAADLADPGCTATTDASETDGECDDGVDNGDSDTLADGADAGCSGTTDTDETSQCEDGLDNDSDTFTDFAGTDPECADASDNDESA